jgi:hypothetical protein
MVRGARPKGSLLLGKKIKGNKDRFTLWDSLDKEQQDIILKKYREYKSHKKQ